VGDRASLPLLRLISSTFSAKTTAKVLIVIEETTPTPTGSPSSSSAPTENDDDKMSVVTQPRTKDLRYDSDEATLVDHHRHSGTEGETSHFNLAGCMTPVGCFSDIGVAKYARLFVLGSSISQPSLMSVHG